MSLTDNLSQDRIALVRIFPSKILLTLVKAFPLGVDLR